jgi:hypothetical protein
MIFHFDFAQWARLLRLAWREPHPAGRRRMLVRLLVFVPVVASFHAVCFFLDGLLFPRLHRIRVEAPVFLVGHARSGTTLLHRLMRLASAAKPCLIPASCRRTHRPARAPRIISNAFTS